LSLDACVASGYRPAISTSLIQNKLPSLGHRARKIAAGKSLAALLTVACLGSEALAVNLILDGSFENITGVPVNNYLLFTGSLGDGWTVTQNEILIERGSLNGIPHSGNQFVYLDGDFGFNTLSQTIPTTPGQSYTISLWVADTYPNLLQVAFAGQTLFNGPAPASGFDNPATNYLQEIFTVTAASSTSTLSISGQWTSGSGTVLDDVSIVAVPEPTAIPLLGGVLALSALMRRRRANVSRPASSL
jgi:hypothetical protein